MRASYETRAWSQSWWPFQALGPVQQATLEFALRCCACGAREAAVAATACGLDGGGGGGSSGGGGFLDIGVAASRAFRDVRLVVVSTAARGDSATALLDVVIPVIAPGAPWVPPPRSVPLPPGVRLSDLRVTLSDSAARVRLSYAPPRACDEGAAAPPVPPPAREPPPPADAACVEDLVLIGEHLELYAAIGECVHGCVCMCVCRHGAAAGTHAHASLFVRARAHASLFVRAPARRTRASVGTDAHGACVVMPAGLPGTGTRVGARRTGGEKRSLGGESISTLLAEARVDILARAADRGCAPVLRSGGRDARANAMLAARFLRRGRAGEAAPLAAAAAASLTAWHPNPVTGEAHYLLGLARQGAGEDARAEAAYGKASWSGGERAAASYRLACLAARRADVDGALGYAAQALLASGGAAGARVLRAALWRRRGDVRRGGAEAAGVLADDPLDHWASREAAMACGRPWVPPSDQATLRDVAGDYADAGCYDDAAAVLRAAPGGGADRATLAALAAVCDAAGDGAGANAVRARAGALPDRRACAASDRGRGRVPARRRRVGAPVPRPPAVGPRAVRGGPRRLDGRGGGGPVERRGAAQPRHRRVRTSARPPRARICISVPHPRVGVPECGRAGGRYNLRGDGAGAAAHYTAARALDPTSGRLLCARGRAAPMPHMRDPARTPICILRVGRPFSICIPPMSAVIPHTRYPPFRYEADQLSRRLGVDPAARLAVLCTPIGTALAAGRDDLTVERAWLLNVAGRPGEALASLTGRRFHPWEGGEGRVVGAHTATRLALCRAALRRGDAAAAAAEAAAADEDPPTLGEARHPHASRADVAWHRGAAAAAAGARDAAAAAFTAAAGGGGRDFADCAVQAVSRASLYEALALRALGRDSAADGVAAALAAASASPRVDYFATSLPDLLVFVDPPCVPHAREAAFYGALAAVAAGAAGPAAVALRALLAADPGHGEAALLAADLDLFTRRWGGGDA